MPELTEPLYHMGSICQVILISGLDREGYRGLAALAGARCRKTGIGRDTEDVCDKGGYGAGALRNDSGQGGTQERGEPRIFEAKRYNNLVERYGRP